MLFAAVRPRLHAGDEAVVQMSPMIGGGISGIDAERFHGVDRLKHTLDLRPTVDPQQNFAAWADERQRLIGLATVNRARDVDARDDGAEVVRGPADKCEGLSGAKRRMRRRRSRIVSPQSWPKRIQCSMRPSSQVSSTSVSSGPALSRATLTALGLALTSALHWCWEIRARADAQRVGNNDATLKSPECGKSAARRRIDMM